MISGVYKWAQKNSIWVIHFNSGGCNGCDIEILDLLTPRYDVERLGILAEASPRHADVLLCTGPVTRQARSGLWQIYVCFSIVIQCWAEWIQFCLWTSIFRAVHAGLKQLSKDWSN